MEVELIEGQPTVTHPRSRLSRLGQVTLYELSSLFYGQPMQIPLQGEISFFENHVNNYVNLGNQTGKVIMLRRGALTKLQALTPLEDFLCSCPCATSLIVVGVIS